MAPRSYCTSIIRWQLHHQCMVLKMEILLICFVHLLENKQLHSTRNYWTLWLKSIEFCIFPFDIYRISEKENRGPNGKIDRADQMQHWGGTKIGKTLHQWQTRTRLQKYYGIAKFLDFKCQSLSRSSQNNPLDTRDHLYFVQVASSSPKQMELEHIEDEKNAFQGTSAVWFGIFWRKRDDSHEWSTLF